MNEITIEKITEVTRGHLISGDPEHVVSSVSTDSRTAGAGSLFIPLVGENHDAHDFVGSALKNGCTAFLISRIEAADDLPGVDVVFVNDTLQAMQDLAHSYLTTLDIEKVAVTGSVGKTSTRDMIWYILSEMHKTARPEKNYNNEIGTPMTLYRPMKPSAMPRLQTKTARTLRRSRTGSRAPMKRPVSASPA